MLDFENTMLEGLNLRVKAKGKLAPRTAKSKLAARPKIAVKAKSIAKKLASPAFKASTPAVKAQVKTLLAKSPALKTAVKASMPMQSAPIAREKLATNIAVKAVTSLANKPQPIQAAIKAVSPAFTPASPTPAIVAQKAAAAIAPIAKACKCQTEPVLARVRARMSAFGYPPNTIDGLLSSLHDMNTALEKAALQRLATYEHNKLSSKSAFEREVLSQLQRLSCNLPKCHPVRTQAHLTIMRKTGVL